MAESEDVLRAKAYLMGEAPATAPANAANLQVDDDARLHALKGAQKALMAPLLAGAPPGSKQETFVRVLDSFMMDYAESSYEAGYDESDYQRIIGNLLKNVAANMKNPFQFAPFHRAVRAPFDFYRWAQSFMNTLILWDVSETLGLDALGDVKACVARGDNVILLANHQTEGDPQVVTLMLEKLGLHALASKVVFVAGHRVTTDPLAIPFSLGCNLLCIFSKKYMEDPPEQKAAKQQRNMDTMGALQGLLAAGGACVWVAPSGGRDRPDPAGPPGAEFKVAPFDAKSVELFRLVAAKANASAKKNAAAALAAAAAAPAPADPAHAAHVPTTKVFTLAMLTRKLVPPPADAGSRDVGEQRTAKRGAVSVKFGGEVTDAAAKACVPAGADKETSRGAFAAVAEAQVRRHFADLVAREKEVLGKM